MSEVGPEESGSNPGLACVHTPEKSGRDALSLCPKAGVKTAAATAMAKGKLRQSIVLLPCSSLCVPPDAFPRRYTRSVYGWKVAAGRRQGGRSRISPAGALR